MNKQVYFSGILLTILAFCSQSFAVSSKNERCKLHSTPTYSIETHKIREKGIVGELVLPKECKSKIQNIIIVLGGSEGGVPDYVAKPFAARGLAALALGYFDVKGEPLPKGMDRIPLEYFENALKKVQDFLPNSICCTMIGFSKGAEGALTFASVLKPQLRGLVLVAGTNMAFEGFVNNKTTNASAWTAKRKDVKFTPYAAITEELLKKMFPKGYDKPAVTSPYYDASMKGPKGKDGVLPIENVQGPILILSGEDDKMWAATKMSNDIVSRAMKKGFKFNIRHDSYPELGHLVLFGEMVLSQDHYNLIRFGGTVEGSRKIEPLVWRNIINFLDKSYQ